jgi:hypothetical protein
MEKILVNTLHGKGKSFPEGGVSFIVEVLAGPAYER